MTEQFSSSQYSQSQVEMELLNALVQEKTPFPWNPLHPEAEPYLIELEQEWGQESECLDSSIHPTSSSLLMHLDTLWSQMALAQSLSRKFSSRVPSTLLQGLAKRVMTIWQQTVAGIETETAGAERLIRCVQEMLPHWSEEDLHVLARPLAYTMRDASTDSLESTLATVRAVNWAELSDIEQARLSLVIAHYAWAEVNSTATPET